MAIQISEIHAYCQLCGLSSPVIRFDLLRMVQAMDSEWLRLNQERG